MADLNFGRGSRFGSQRFSNGALPNSGFGRSSSFGRGSVARDPLNGSQVYVNAGTGDNFVGGDGFARSPIATKKQLFSQTLKVIICLQFFLLAFWCWVGYIYKFQDRYTNMYFAEHNLGPAMKYFDANRNTQGIKEIQYKLKPTDQCKKGLETLTDPLFTWPGSYAGYLKAGKFEKGTDASAVAVEETKKGATLKVESWLTRGFCVARVKDEDFESKLETQSCKTGQATCSPCQCSKLGSVKTGKCPVKEMKISLTSPGKGIAKTAWRECGSGVPGVTANGGVVPLAWCQYEESKTTTGLAGTDLVQASEVIDLSVEFYGEPCMDAAENPKGAWYNWPLYKENRKGCDKKLGQDLYSRVVDKRLERDFLFRDNAGVFKGGTYKQLKDKIDVVANEQYVYLWARHKIPATCAPECQAFRFYPKGGDLLTSLKNAWDRLKIAACIACVSFFMIFFATLGIAFMKGKPNQKLFLGTYIIALLAIAAVIVVVSMFVFLIGSDYNVNRDYFKSKEDCITDPAWKKVVTDIYAFTSLEWFKSISYLFLITLCIVLIFGALFLYRVLTRLG